MSTTIKMWAVFDPEGKPLWWTISKHETVSQDKTILFLSWEVAAKIGYTCRPVRVTIEEIEKPKTKSDE